jgi:hypothetical protein
MSNPANPSKIEQLPVSPGADVLPVQFKRPGRKARANVVPIPDPELVPGTKHRRPRLKKVPDSLWLYHYPNRPREYFCRPWFEGRQREKKLKAVTRSAAEIEVSDLMRDIKNYVGAGIGKNPFARTEKVTVSDLCDFYARQKYPRPSGPPAPGVQLKQEKKRVEWLKKWGKNKAADEITLEHVQKYHDWRVRFLKRETSGGRTVDLELTTLSNIFLCAMRNKSKTGVAGNPIGQGRVRFQKNVKHCRDFMPRTADELHSLSRYFFQSVETEVFGWIVLFQALVGHRINEVLKLRVDAKASTEPGFVDGSRLYLWRSDSHKGAYGHVDLFKALEACLAAHKIWHRKRFPVGNPWYFPSPRKPLQSPKNDALTKALERATPELKMEKRTSHGLRAYRVNVLRSQGKLDAEIALRIGQKSGERLIREVYGEGLADKLDYWPTPDKIAPAWDKWLPKEKKTGHLVIQGDLL